MEKIYLLGDSITEWNIIRHTDILNFGKAGWTTKDLLDNFPQLEEGNLGPALVIGVLLFVGVSLFNIVAVRRKVASIWMHKG